MSAPLALTDAFKILYWPHSSRADAAPDGAVGMRYEWRCGCSAFTLDSHDCRMTWCGEHRGGAGHAGGV